MSDWDLRSNIKNKPGSQGTLFQGGRGQLNPSRRWPRGYTPDRLHEIRIRTDNVPMEPTKSDPLAFRARVNETIAQSTVDPDAVVGLSRMDDVPNPGHLGTHRSGAAAWDRRSEISVNIMDPERDRTLIHEIGHHVDWTNKETDQHLPEISRHHAALLRDKRGIEGEPNSTEVAYARSDVAPGIREAVADNFYEKHYRTRSRNQKAPTRGLYEETYTPEERHVRVPGYNDVRRPLSPQQFPDAQGTLF